MAREQQELLRISYACLVLNIDILQWLRRARGESHTKYLERELKMVEEGIQWLQDINRYEWRGSLLLQQGDTLAELGRHREALEVVEDAYRLSKTSSLITDRAECAKMVIRSAHLLGDRERAFQILEEAEQLAVSTGNLNLMQQCLDLLMDSKPTQVMKCLDIARRLVEQANQQDDMLGRLYAYIRLTSCAIMAASFTEARNALSMVREIALNDQSLMRPYILHQALRHFRELKDRNIVRTHSGDRLPKIYRLVKSLLRFRYAQTSISSIRDTVDVSLRDIQQLAALWAKEIQEELARN